MLSAPRPAAAVKPAALLLGSVALVLLVWRGAPPRLEYSTAPHTIEDTAKALLQDEIFCASKDPVTGAFCRNDLPEGRAEIVQQVFDKLSTCRYGTASRWGPAVPLKEYVKNQSVPWTSSSPFMKQYESSWEKDKEYSVRYSQADASVGDWWMPGQPELYLDRCEVPPDAEGDAWTFDRFGPFKGHGHEWHAAGWTDAGAFASKLGKGSVWVTAFGFYPAHLDGSMIGLPPVHIHHMHVSSSQHVFRFALDGKKASDDTYAVEFDVHGDRQCPVGMGGMNCTVRAFPPGFGIFITDPMETVYDTKDIRAAGSPVMPFYTQHAFRWTHRAQRPVAKMLTGIYTASFGYFHDDYLLTFDASKSHEYLYWSEQVFKFTGSFAHMYWHTHHKYTEDMWAIAGSAADLDLMGTFGSAWVDLPSLGWDTASAQKFVLERVATAQAECHRNKCTSYPAVKCTMVQDRWEAADVGSMGGFFPRYRIPYCARWDFKKGDIITIVSFHKLQSHVHLTSKELYWMHTALYGFAIPTPDVFGDNISAKVPHIVDFLPTPGYLKQLGLHAGWWEN